MIQIIIKNMFETLNYVKKIQICILKEAVKKNLKKVANKTFQTHMKNFKV